MVAALVSFTQPPRSMAEVTNTVRFVLDGALIEAQGVRRTTTVLDYLRERLHRTGTKEGCAEGDCGACVVLVGSLNAAGDGIDYLPVNSCIQLLPALDGKSIKTVESLQQADGTLHPVQQAMVDCHGSQCGFCTPGFVMSLAHLAHTAPTAPSRGQITDAISGNLCRCTGYQPIIEAAQQACALPQAQRRIADAQDIDLLKSIARATHPTVSLEGEIIVQPVVRTRKGSEFVSPASVQELAAYLQQRPHAKLLAGSTEVGLQVNKTFARPSHICYVGNVAELQAIDSTAQHWDIGAAVSLQRVMALVAPHYPDFAEVLRRFGSPPIRSTATLAGNIVNGSPIGDTMPCLMALDAELVLQHGSQQRRVPLHAFYTGMKQSVLQPGEFVRAVRLPKPQPNQVFRAHKISKRFEQDISATCCAASYRLDTHGTLRDVRVAYNGLAPSPCRATAIEAVLEGKSPESVQADEIDGAIASSFVARDGLRATWTYRALVARNLVLRFVRQPQPQATQEG